MPSTGDFIRARASKWLPNNTKVGTIEQINFVSQMITNPCRAPWAVYVETFFPAALEAGIALIDFDEGDALRFIFRPKGLYRGGHVKGGFWRRQAGKVIGLRELQNRKYTNGVKNLWIFDTTLQRVFFWFMIFDIATDFVYNWTSLAYNTSSCGEGSALLTAVPGPAETFGGWASIVYPTVEYDSPAVRSSGYGFAFFSGVGMASAGMQAHNASNLYPATLELRVRAIESDVIIEDYAAQTFQPGDSGQLLVQIPKSQVGSVELAIRTTGGGSMYIDSGDAFAAASG